MSTIAAGVTSGTALVNTGDTTGNLVFQTNGTTTALTLNTSQNATFAGTVSDAAGNLRAIPRSGSAKTTSYTLTTGDVGEYIEVGSGGSVTIPNSTFSTGDAVVIANNTTGNITITCSISSAYIAGTDSVKASITLATRGLANILFLSGTVCIVSGNVS